MPFVKLDCGMLNSTLWFDPDATRLFLTALLLAEPIELKEEQPQFEVRSLKETGWMVPVGWYGFVPAAGTGIIRRAGIDLEPGMVALERLGSEEIESRSQDFGGRRLVRINGGYLVLNYIKYRERDYTSAERSKRYRERLRHAVAPLRHAVASRDITQAEGEEEVHKKSTPLPPKKGEDGGKPPVGSGNKVRVPKEGRIPTREEAVLYGAEIGMREDDVLSWCDHFDSNGWKVGGKTPMKDWKAALRNGKRHVLLAPGATPAMSPEHRENKINLLNEKKAEIFRQITDPIHPPSWAVKDLEKINKQLQVL